MFIPFHDVKRRPSFSYIYIMRTRYTLWYCCEKAVVCKTPLRTKHTELCVCVKSEKTNLFAYGRIKAHIFAVLCRSGGGFDCCSCRFFSLEPRCCVVVWWVPAYVEVTPPPPKQNVFSGRPSLTTAEVGQHMASIYFLLHLAALHPLQQGCQNLASHASTYIPGYSSTTPHRVDGKRVMSPKVVLYRVSRRERNKINKFKRLS